MIRSAEKKFRHHFSAIRMGSRSTFMLLHCKFQMYEDCRSRGHHVLLSCSNFTHECNTYVHIGYTRLRSRSQAVRFQAMQQGPVASSNLASQPLATSIAGLAPDQQLDSHTPYVHKVSRVSFPSKSVNKPFKEVWLYKSQSRNKEPRFTHHCVNSVSVAKLIQRLYF